MKEMRIAALALAASLAFSGCSFMGEKVFVTFGNGIGNIFKIGDMGCPKEEALVYLANSYQLYGKSGGGSIWDMDIDTSKLEENIKTRVLKHLSMVYALNIYAGEQDITLTDTELDKVSKAADEYVSTLSDKDKEYLNVKKSDVKDMYEHLALAKKVYVGLMSTVDDEVSEDEARVMRAYVIKVADESTAKDVAKAIKAGRNFDEIAAEYSEDNKEEISFGRGELPPSVEEVAFGLDNDQISDRISASDGFYYIKCIAKYDKELSDKNKQAIIEAHKEELLNDIIAGQNDKYYSGLDEKKWAEISAVPDEGVTTDRFFEIISDYVSF